MRVCSNCHRCYETEVYSCTDESHPALSEIRNGSCETIAGYRLDLLLESGVKGEIYLADHTASDRSCLVKILRADAQNSEQFLYEAQVASGLFHPNVADIYEAGTLESGELYLVAEETGGQTLREYLKIGGVPELLTSIEIVRQIAEALHALHLKGLIHRAVNPENIILTVDTENRPLVRIKDLDFGGVVERSVVSNKFLIDSALDSLKYFSPEQCSGGAVNMKTDVYSLGIVLYEMLAGAPPFVASKASGLIEKHKNERPPEIWIGDFELRMLVTHTLTESLSKRAEKRQSSANAFARQLRHVEQLATHVSTPPPAGAASRPPARAAVSAAAAAPARSGSFQAPVVMVEAPAVIFRNESEPIVAMEAVDDLPEIPGLLAEQIIENLVEEVKIAPAPPRRSRLKLRRKVLHARTAPTTSELLESKILPTVQPARTPVKVQAMPAEIPAVQVEPEKTAAIPIPSLRTKIEWDQPEDDIPSVADVLEVLGGEQLTEIAAASSAPEMIAAVQEEPQEMPIVLEEPKKITAVHEEPQEITVEPEMEEITVVTAPGRRITVEWEQPAAQRGLYASNEVTFFPTILGGTRETETIEADPGGSILSAYYASSRSGFSLPYRAIGIGGGFVALVVLFLLGNDLVWRYSSTGGSGDSVAAKTAPAKETLPQAPQTTAVSPSRKKDLKYFENPRLENNNADANQSKQIPSASQNTGKTIPPALVAPSDKGKASSKIQPEKITAEQKPVLIISNKPADLIRPRVVRDPRP